MADLKNNPLLVLLIGFMALSMAILIHRLLKKDIRNLETEISKDNRNLETKMSKGIRNLETKIDSLKELFTAQLKPIQENLTNHVTDANKKIDDLKKDMKDGHSKLEAKLDRILAEKKA